MQLIYHFIVPRIIGINQLFHLFPHQNAMVLALLTEIAHILRVHQLLIRQFTVCSSSSNFWSASGWQNGDHICLLRLRCSLESFVLSTSQSNLLTHHQPTGTDKGALKRDTVKEGERNNLMDLRAFTVLVLTNMSSCLFQLPMLPTNATVAFHVLWHPLGECKEALTLNIGGHCTGSFHKIDQILFD